MRYSLRGDAERQLWCAVLYQAFHDGLGFEGDKRRPFIGQRDTRIVMGWIGSRDFRIVCNLAGADPDYIEAGFRKGLKV